MDMKWLAVTAANQDETFWYYPKERKFLEVHPRRLNLTVEGVLYGFLFSRNIWTLKIGLGIPYLQTFWLNKEEFGFGHNLDYFTWAMELEN